MQISFADPLSALSGTAVVPVYQERVLGAAGRRLDESAGGTLNRAMTASRFTGKKEETLELLAPAGLPVARVLLVGLGRPEQATPAIWEAAGCSAVAALNRCGETTAFLLADLAEGCETPAAEAACALAVGARLRGYRFDKYRTTEKPDQKPSLKSLTILTTDPGGEVRALFARAEAVCSGVMLTRDLVSEPANRLTPPLLAERCRDLTALGVEVEVLDERAMAALGMGALLGVAQGSANPPRLVVMKWTGNPGAADPRPLALVGKGVTFDSGGISIKPAGGMEDMKWDMAGAGVVIGTLHALAARKARANVVGVVGLVENMPSGTAQRPGDVVTSLSGQTIEVINTDAEGRLVLADALWYAQDNFKPQLMIDLATLTGAVIIALGNEQAGLFSTSDELAARLAEAGKQVNEPLWRLPLGDAYDKELNSDIADMKNVGSGRNAGSTVGAQFLKRFVKDVPWAHLDIAGVTWSKKDSATVPKGGTGFGVRLLDSLIAEHYEA